MPQNEESAWAAVENVIKKGTGVQTTGPEYKAEGEEVVGEEADEETEDEKTVRIVSGDDFE